jgi:hypothetical protein
MNTNYPLIVLYMGGTCGDLLVSVIDNTHSRIDNTRILATLEKNQFKRVNELGDDANKHAKLLDLGRKFKAVPSHDADYHIKFNHKYIAIEVDSIVDAMWAARRFVNLHLAFDWAIDMQRGGEATIKAYADQIMAYTHIVTPSAFLSVNLRDIRGGKLIDILQPHFRHPLDSGIYTQWLITNKG